MLQVGDRIDRFVVEAFLGEGGISHVYKVRHHQLGTVLHRMNRYDEALHHYKKSLEIHDDNALTDYCIAQVD